MSAQKAKTVGNAPGKYYIDERCIGCALCHETAPDHFKTNDEEGCGFVFRQPETPEEERLCMTARDACPMDAVQDDGLESGYS